MEQNFNILFKEKLRETFKKTIKFLDENHLEYRVAYGTTIGTVRHKDLIPWDDDIDIYMFREDYNKLPSLVPQMKEYGLDLLMLPYTEDYWQTFAKIYDINTTVIEREHVPNVGVWVDIFPLDYTDNDKEQIAIDARRYSRRFYKYWKAILKYPFKHYIGLLKKKEFKDFRQQMKNRTFYRLKKKKSLKRFLELSSRLEKPSGRYLVSYFYNEFFPTEWIEPYIYMPFADFEVKVPAEYDKVLTQLYGDYMTPPPENERIATHGIFYTNLERRLTLKEAKESIANKEYETNPNVAYTPQTED